MAKLSPTEKVLAIDPGTEESAYVIWNGVEILKKCKDKNSSVLTMIYAEKEIYHMVIEQVRCYGMAIGQTTLDTVFWTGRFFQQWPGYKSLMPRMDVKMHICHNSRAKDGNIRQALIDRFEPNLKPRQRPKEMLKGLSGDTWQAFALAVTWWDKEMRKAN